MYHIWQQQRQDVILYNKMFADTPHYKLVTKWSHNQTSCSHLHIFVLIYLLTFMSAFSITDCVPLGGYFDKDNEVRDSILPPLPFKTTEQLEILIQILHEANNLKKTRVANNPNNDILTKCPSHVL